MTHVINGLKGLAESTELTQKGKDLAILLEARIKTN